MRKPIRYLLALGFTAFILMLAVGITSKYVSASSSASRVGSAPVTQDAFARWAINGTTPSEITLTVGTPLTMDLLVNSGSNTNVTAQQSYLQFSYTNFQVVRAGQPTCVLTSTLTADTTTFEGVLQNEVCNGPNPCTFRGQQVDPGLISFASGALTNCPTGCGGEFRVGSIGLCGTTPGEGLLHWQFSPPAPAERDSEIVTIDNTIVSSPPLYHDVIVHVVGAGGTPTPTTTRTATPTVTGSVTPATTATPCPITFTDVHETDYFYEAVRYLYCAGAISGYADNTFRPYNNTTRGQLSKIVVLAEGWTIDTTGGPHFSDVPESSPFYAYIETAYAHGIISGYANGTFGPGNNVTRGQLSKIVVLAEGWPLRTPTVATFSDVPPGSPFFSYVETAYCHGIISGYADTTFRPYNNATRGQIAKIVYQARVGTQQCP